MIVTVGSTGPHRIKAAASVERQINSTLVRRNIAHGTEVRPRRIKAQRGNDAAYDTVPGAAWAAHGGNAKSDKSPQESHWGK